MNLAKQTLFALVSALVVFVGVGTSAEARSGSPAAGQQAFAPATNDELDALVAPIALYPDPLLAQVLGAATYPDQVVEADTYVRANLKLRWEDLIKGAEERSWDPSVTGLVQFSGVLNRLAKNITWTSMLGEAMANQQVEVMAAIQRMRAKAHAAGNLKSGERIKVAQEKNVIVIQPVNPKMIYVPSFNPAMVYGTPVTTPSISTGDQTASAAITFGLGVAAGGPLRGSSCGWRYGYWHIDWAEWTIQCGDGIYFGNPYWWGGSFPGFYATQSRKGSTGAHAAHSSEAGMPTTRPGPGMPKARPSAEELRGYPVGENAKPAPNANAFSGTVGGRAESARGKRSLNGAPAPNEGQVQR